jgi:hypothetical protein
VIGKNPEKQLAPFKENLNVEWVDKTEEYRKQYETEKVDEFFCNSHSSWGQQISKELFEFIKNNKPGAIAQYMFKKQGGQYLTKDKKYRGYFTLADGKRCKGDAWFEVTTINKTDHPNKNVCFEGIVTIRAIKPPKKISLKTMYPDYNTYLTDWHGIDDVTKQGYWHNPNAKWDWYALGGRWTGFFKLKPNTVGEIGAPGLITSPAQKGYADQVYKAHIDFEAMEKESSTNAEKSYNVYLEKIAKGETVHPYFEFGIENVSELKDDFIAESKESYIKRNSRFSTFAVLKDGKWYEKGKMGWWGTVSNKKEDSQWETEFAKLIADLPDTTLLSLYDCHI